MRNPERGAALLWVLMVTALLSGLVVAASVRSQSARAAAGAERDRQAAYWLARGGAEAAVAGLELDDPTVDHLQEPWAAPHALPVEQGELSVQIVDTGGRLDLSTLVDADGNPDIYRVEALTRLLEHLGAQRPACAVDHLLDWLDADLQPRPQGSERAADGSEARNAPVLFLGELSGVGCQEGVDAESFRRLVAPYGGTRINVNTASAEVIASLVEGLPLETARQITAERQRSPFTSVSSLSRVAGLDEFLPLLRPHLTAGSRYFQITSSAVVDEQRVVVETLWDRAKNTHLWWRTF